MGLSSDDSIKSSSLLEGHTLSAATGHLEGDVCTYELRESVICEAREDKQMTWWEAVIKEEM